jgi:FMN reductase
MEQRITRILAIGGSNREGSQTLNVLRNVLDLAEQRGATTDLIDIRQVQLPVFEPVLAYEDQPAALLALLTRIQQADAFLVASPTYHGTVTGAVKNLLDAIHIFRDRERGTFAGRPVGLIAYGGPSAMNTVNALHHTVRGIAGFVVPTVLTVSRAQLNENLTQIADERTLARAGTLIDEVLRLARLQRFAEAAAGV